MPPSPRPLCVLTGASAGIGAALAPILAREGYDLVLVARREAMLADVAKRVGEAAPGARAEPFALDLAAPDAAERLFERAPDAALVVNNAGFGKLGPAVETDIATYRRMIEVNVTALTGITILYARRMVERGSGTIVNVASTAAFQTTPYYAVYGATKAYVVYMSEALHYEVRPRGVSVLAYCPGPTETEFAEIAGAQAFATGSKALFQTAEAVAEDVARAIGRRRETRIPGFLNRLAAFMARTAPRRLVRWTTAKVMAQGLPAPRALPPPAPGPEARG